MMWIHIIQIRGIRMPFILKNKQTSEIFTCHLINNYQIPFFGTKFWDNPYTAQKEYITFLETHQVVQTEEWELIEVEEHQLKLFNVKLNNNPTKSLFLDENGKSTIKITE
jgi:hypothetical protein